MDSVELVSNGFKIISYKRKILKNEQIKKILYINWDDIETIFVEETKDEELVSITIITKLRAKYLIYKNNFEYDLDKVVIHILKFKEKSNIFKVVFFDIDNLLEKASY